MFSERVENLLERIAAALERLADAANNRTTKNGAPIIFHESNVLPDIKPALPEKKGEAEQMAQSLLLNHLQSRGIQIKHLPTPDPHDNVIDNLSLYLGENYAALDPLLTKIKRSMQTGGSITEDLRNRPPKDISINCQFCTKLYEVAFLAEYHYRRAPFCTIHARTTALPTAKKFFGGQWLERFILQKVKSVHSQIASEISATLPFEFLINPQIVLPNSQDFELDVLAAIGPQIYWIEAKSGDYQQHLHKYSKFGRVLGLDVDHSFLVLTDASEALCRNLSSIYQLTVCNISQFEERLLSLAREDTRQIVLLADEQNHCQDA